MPIPRDLSEIEFIGFDWDKGNKDKNLEKHRVLTDETEEIFFNEPLQFIRDIKHSQTEERIVAYGITDKGRKLTVVFTIRKERIRIISARDQNIKERRQYEKTKTNTEV